MRIIFSWWFTKSFDSEKFCVPKSCERLWDSKRLGGKTYRMQTFGRETFRFSNPLGVKTFKIVDSIKINKQLIVFWV